MPWRIYIYIYKNTHTHTYTYTHTYTHTLAILVKVRCSSVIPSHSSIVQKLSECLHLPPRLCCVLV